MKSDSAKTVISTEAEKSAFRQAFEKFSTNFYMIERYALPEMVKIWSEERRFQIWLQIEILACEAWNRLGEIPDQTLDVIRKKASFRLPEIRKAEETNQHEMIAFLESVQKSVGPESRFIHFGLTSSDIMDTALAVQLKEAGGLLRTELDHLIQSLRKKAEEYRGMICVARTHGIHAEPTTFGLKLLGWVAELERQKNRLAAACREVAAGKISGAVGTYAHVSPEVESYVCQALGLTPEPVSTQVVPRDRHAQFLSAAALIGCSLEKFAMEIRHLQRTEVGEAAEPFGKGQKGSSAMPHKKNPILCERIAGLARLLRGYALTGYENVALWHERDISHSSVERVSLPDSSILLHYMLRTFHRVVSGLEVYPEKMRENLERNGGLVYSGKLLLALVEKGMLRQEAYEAVQSLAMKAIQENQSFFEMVSVSPQILSRMKKEEIRKIFDPSWFVRHEKEIYARLSQINAKE